MQLSHCTVKYLSKPTAQIMDTTTAAKVTAEEAREAIAKSGVQSWPSRSCSICESVLTYHFANAGDVLDMRFNPDLQPNDLIVGFDSSCDCSSHLSDIKMIGWQNFANHLTNHPEQWAQLQAKTR